MAALNGGLESSTPSVPSVLSERRATIAKRSVVTFGDSDIDGGPMTVARHETCASEPVRLPETSATSAGGRNGKGRPAPGPPPALAGCSWPRPVVGGDLVEHDHVCARLLNFLDSLPPKLILDGGVSPRIDVVEACAWRDGNSDQRGPHEAAPHCAFVLHDETRCAKREGWRRRSGVQRTVRASSLCLESIGIPLQNGTRYVTWRSVPLLPFCFQLPASASGGPPAPSRPGGDCPGSRGQSFAAFLDETLDGEERDAAPTMPTGEGLATGVAHPSAGRPPRPAVHPRGFGLASDLMASKRYPRARTFLRCFPSHPKF